MFEIRPLLLLPGSFAAGSNSSWRNLRRHPQGLTGPSDLGGRTGPSEELASTTHGTPCAMRNASTCLWAWCEEALVASVGFQASTAVLAPTRSSTKRWNSS